MGKLSAACWAGLVVHSPLGAIHTGSGKPTRGKADEIWKLGTNR